MEHEISPCSALDAVIVLGAAVWEGGVPSPSLLRRTLYGCNLLLSGEARLLIASGGVGRFPPSEASVIRRIALENGVPSHSILLEERARSTVENAFFSTALLRANKCSSAWIVSDRYHLLRAVVLFRQLGIHAKGRAPDLHGTGTRRVIWYYLHLRELLALPSSLARMLLLKKKFGGKEPPGRNLDI